jgi:hypothetical protein
MSTLRIAATMWQQNVVAPLRVSGKTVPELILVSSPYRFVVTPLVESILKVERDHPDRQIAVLVPELVVKHWWQTPGSTAETASAGKREIRVSR